MSSPTPASPLPSSSDDRLPKLHASALSPREYSQFVGWAKEIQLSPSGVEGLLDEQDALAWLRRECAIGRVDEIKILSLFERYPLGLEPGHFFALLRLASWVQQGRTPLKSLLFTQTDPPLTGLPAGASFPLPTTTSPTGSRLTQRPIPSIVATEEDASAKSAPLQPTAPVAGTQPSVSTPSSKVPPPASAPASHLQSPLAIVSPTPVNPAGPSLQPRVASSSMLPPPVPPESSKPSRSPGPSNPFRSVSSHSRSASLAIAQAESLHGNESAANPFKQVKPKVVRPTPIVATPGNPNPTSAAHMPRAATAVSMAPGLSGFSGRSARSIEDFSSPPLPPRPSTNEKPPPPLPPRAHISPLIQAGLEASMQVRKQKGALPPKTFTVLQSSTSKAKAPEPRLLTGESAPLALQHDLLPPPTHHAKRRVSGHEAKRSISEANSAYWGTGMRRGPSDETNDGPQRAVSGSATIIAAPKPSRPGQSRHRGSGSASGGSQVTSSVVVPKAHYAGGTGSLRSKPTLPSWLREQEELQRSALIDGRALSPPPADSIPDDEDHRRAFSLDVDRERSRNATTVLDEEFDVFPTELKEQASRAASIDRPHNPFVHRSSQVEAEKLRIQPSLLSRGADQSFEDQASSSSRSPEISRPLGRSKTLHGKAAPPPPPPYHSSASRRRLESVPATLDSGTYAGFRLPAQGGLRLMPPSAKADVGLGEIKRPIARRDSSALSISSSSGAAPMSPRGDGESGETSLNSTNVTSIHGLDRERNLSNRSEPPTTNGLSGPIGSLKDKVSDFLKLQDAPPKGQRPIDGLKRDAMRLAERKGWIRRGDDEGLLKEENEEGSDDDGERAAQDSVAGVDRWDNDAPTPDDAYDRDNTPMQTDTSATPMGSRDTPPPPPRRSVTMSAAPVARRPSGYVARRASKIEGGEGSGSFDFGHRDGSSSPSAHGLGRAASFSARANRNSVELAGPTSAGTVSKRASWLENLRENNNRRSGSEGIRGPFDDDEAEEAEESDANVADLRQWDQLH